MYDTDYRTTSNGYTVQETIYKVKLKMGKDI